MPSVSKSQQRLMGMAYAVKSGDMEISDIDPAYRDKVKSLSDGMTKKDLKKYASTKHEDLPETVDEDFAQAQQHITPSANIGGMGPVILPSDGGVGSGDVPSVADIDDDEEEAKKDKTKKKLEMEGFKLFTQFSNFINEGLAESDKVYEEAILENAVRDLHFETDPKRAEELKIEIGTSQGEVTRRKQIEGGEYSLRRFRKEIKYDETGEDLGVFKPGSYMAATSTLGDGPHKKVVKKRRWNQKMYNQWIEDVASNGGWEHAFDMAQNAKHEHGLIDWVKKNYRDDDPMQRIQWDIEAFAESVVIEAESVKVGEYIKTQYGYFYKRVDGKVGGQEAFVEIKKGKEGKRKTSIHDTVSFEIVDKDAAFESLVTEKSWNDVAKVMDAGLKKAIKKGITTLRYAKDYVKSLERMANKEAKKFFDEYGDFTEDDWIEDVRYNMANEKVKDYFSEWVALNEKKEEDRDGMMKFIKKHMSFVGTSEDFNGSEGGIHVSGENWEDEFKGQTIYDYYSEDYKNREFGVLNSWEKELNKRGWYSEWYDAGTVMIWPL